MQFEHRNRKYELIKGSDVGNDTMYLELNDITNGQPQYVLFGEKTSDGELRFLSLVNKSLSSEEPILLPIDLVENFIQLFRYITNDLIPFFI